MNSSPTSRHALLASLAVLLLSVPAEATQLVQVPVTGQVGARVWLANSSEYLRRGERLDVRFSVPQDAYVAVVHIGSDGAMDFLYPSSPWRSELVRGGRVHTLSSLGAGSRYARSDGIGYLYLIASPRPLDFSYFRAPVGSGWYWGPAGQAVHGDPFLAFEQVTRIIVPQWPAAMYVSDAFGYYVGTFYPYPAFACSNFRYGSGWGWTASYGPCLLQDSFLRLYPYYYDTRRFAGDRRVYLRQFERLDPVHGFKEAPGGPAVTVPGRVGVPARTTAPPARDGFLPDGSAGRTPLAEPASRPAAAPASGTQGRDRPVPSAPATTVAPPPSTSNSGARGTPAPATTNRAGGGASAAPSTPANSGRGATTTPAAGTSRRQ